MSSGQACVNCDEAGWPSLCPRCESKYRDYVAGYTPHRSHPGGSRTGYFRMSKPQTRHQWAAHQKKASR
jgi:hypothetical protein